MTTIIKISGKPIEQPETCSMLWDAIARAARGGDLIVVHGGGRQVDARLAALGMTSERIGGLRVTTEEQIGVIASVLAGEVSRAVTGLLVRSGVRAVGIGACDGGLLTAEQDRPELGRVGTVTGGDPTLVRSLLDSGFVPVVNSIGFDSEGGLLNINADDAAAGLASLLGADRLVLVTDVAGVLDANGERVDELTSDLIDAGIADGSINGGMAVKARAALRVADCCDADVVVGSWHDAEALLSGDPVGTKIVGERRRPMLAEVG